MRTKRGKEVAALLRNLLRTPKTRAGLVAAVRDRGVSESSVNGWLVKAEDAGLVVRVTGRTYKHSRFVLSGKETHTPAPLSPYPAWMGASARLPEFTERRIYRLGDLEGVFYEQEEPKERGSCNKTRTPPRGSSST